MLPLHLSYLPTSPMWWFPPTFSFILILIIAIDLRRRRIPHVLTVGGMVLALVGRGSVSAELIISGCIGAMLAFALFAMIYLFGRYYFGTRALGFGDVMLATMIGAVLGPIAALWALAMGLLLAGCYALWLLWHRHAQRLTTIPFAPFLAFPALVALWLP